MDFTEKLRLHGQAEENLYFAKLDQQLIDALHKKRDLNQQVDAKPETQHSQADLLTSADK